MKRISLLLVLFMTILTVPTFAAKPTKFWFMPFIYRSLAIKDTDKVSYQEESIRKVKFTYDGVAYEAQAMNAGMIHMKGNGREWIINFDMGIYKRPTMVIPYKTD